MLRVHAKGRAGGRRRKFARFRPCNAWRLPEGLPAPSLKAVKEKMGGKKPACFSVRKREIKKRKNHWLLRFLLRFFAVKNVPLTKERSEFPVQGSPHAAFLWRARLSRKFPLSGGSLPARLGGSGRLLAIVAGVVGGIAVIVFFRYIGIVFHAVEHRAQNGAA